MSEFNAEYHLAELALDCLSFTGEAHSPKAAKQVEQQLAEKEAAENTIHFETKDTEGSGIESLKPNQEEAFNQKSQKLFKYRTISRELYDLLVGIYPILTKKNNSYQPICWKILITLIERGEMIFAHNYVKKLDIPETANGKAINKFQELLPDLFTVKEYCVELERPRTLLLKDNETTQKLCDLHHNLKDEERVFILSGRKTPEKPRVKQRLRKQIKKDFMELVNNRLSLDTLPLIKEYYTLVNELSEKQTRRRMIARNIEAAREYIKSIKQSDEARYKSYVQVLNNIQDLVNFNCYAPTKKYSPRIFDLTDQNIPNKLKEILFCGCVDLDIKASQLTTIASLAGEAGDELYCIINDSMMWEWVVEQVFNEQDPSTYKTRKMTIKKALAKVINCGRLNYWSDQDRRKGIYMNKHHIEAFKQSCIYKALVTALRGVKERIKADGGIDIGGCFRRLEDDLKESQIISHKIQWLESMIIYGVCQAIKKENDSRNKISLIMVAHDGLLVDIKERKFLDSSIVYLKNAAKETAQHYGIKGLQLTSKIV